MKKKVSDELKIDEAMSRKDILKLALAKHKYKKSGGKVEKQPPTPASGKHKYRGMGILTPMSKDDEKMAKALKDYKKKLWKKKYGKKEEIERKIDGFAQF